MQLGVIKNIYSIISLLFIKIYPLADKFHFVITKSYLRFDINTT